MCLFQFWFPQGRNSLVAQMVKNMPAIWETQVRSLGPEDPLQKDMATPPIFLPGKSHRHELLRPWGHKESDTTEWLHFTFFPQGICLSMGLLGIMVVLFLVFKEILIPFSIVAVSICIPTSSARGFPFLHTLSSIYCLKTFWWGPVWLIWGGISL